MEKSTNQVAACSTFSVIKSSLFLCLISFSLLFSACQSGGSDSKNQALAELAEIEFEEDVYDFGDVTPKGKVTHEFSFTNTSDNPLVITQATASCGCTVPSYPTKPIEPGESGEISVIYNAASTPGDVTKTVTVVANTYPAKTILTLKGTIKP
jgi:hypothetical protein